MVIKKLLFTIACCLGFLSLAGQAYQDMFEDEKVWRYAFTVCDAGGGIEVFAEGDTTIGEQHYRILRVRNCGTVSTGGLVRTDTDNARLWVRRPGGSEDRLVMDLSLQPGDTFTIYDDDQPETVSVDSVRTVDGRRQVFLGRERSDCMLGGDSGLYLRFIEGMGPSTGFFFYEGSEYLFAYFLACAETGGQLIYQEPVLAFLGCDLDCTTTGVTPETEPHPAIRLSPNPVADRLFLSGVDAGADHLHLRIFTTGGRQVLARRLTSAAPWIDTGHLPAGLYLAVLSDARRAMVWSGRFVRR